MTPPCMCFFPQDEEIYAASAAKHEMPKIEEGSAPDHGTSSELNVGDHAAAEHTISPACKYFAT